MLTPEERQVIEERTNAATPGPWDYEPHGHIEEGCRCLSCIATTGWHLSHQIDCEDAVLTMPDDRPKPRNSCASEVLSYEDAHFIAHARTDVVRLLADVRQLTEDRDQARAETERLRTNYAAARQRHELDYQYVADQLFASCICNRDAETTNGPEEDCPVHGADEHRPLALRDRVRQAEADRDRDRALLSQIRRLLNMGGQNPAAFQQAVRELLADAKRGGESS